MLEGYGMQALFDQLQEIFYTLEKNKLRTLLTGLTVSWGIFMLILLLGAGQGMENGVRYSFEKDAVNSIWISPGQTSLAHAGFKQGRRIQFQNDDLTDLNRSVSERELISGRAYLNQDTVVRYANVAGRFQVVGIHADYLKIENSQSAQGRLLHLSDEKRAGKVAIIGVKVRKELFGKLENRRSHPGGSHAPKDSGMVASDTPVGQYIQIKGIPFLIVGVFDDPDDEWQQDRIYIPLSTFQRVFTRNDRLHNIVMTVQSVDITDDKDALEHRENKNPEASSKGEDVEGHHKDVKDKKNGQYGDEERIEQKIRDILARRHHFSPEDKRAVYLHNSLIKYRKYLALFANIRIFIWVIGIGSIVAGIVGISNIMLITVRERTREIGIRKALGAPPAAIVRMVLMESLLITVGFGYIGIVTGVALLELMGKMLTGVAYFRNPGIDLGVAFGALGILVFSGVTAGFFPALRASRIRPVEALRDE